MMHLKQGFICHIYNRGNNKGKIFHTPGNYEFFIEKIKKHVMPYADILAWCLMPNHFHLMIEINTLSINNITLNKSIGIMLCSYARAINLQENRTGSLFQQHTRAICLNLNDKIKPSWVKMTGATKLMRTNEGMSYPEVCIRYIHDNPIRAGNVFKLEYWRYSSYHEIFEGDGTYRIVNLDKLKKIVRRL